MKVFFCILLALSFSLSYGQKIKEYKASNDSLYQVGDTIQLGVPSGDSHFKFLQMNSSYQLVSAPGTQMGLPATFANTYAIIKKIKKGGGIKPKIWFIISFGPGGKYLLDVESALQIGELIR